MRHRCAHRWDWHALAQRWACLLCGHTQMVCPHPSWRWVTPQVTACGHCDWLRPLMEAERSMNEHQRCAALEGTHDDPSWTHPLHTSRSPLTSDSAMSECSDVSDR